LNSVGDTGEQIREHKLACSIINLHGTDNAVFDQGNLDLLKSFTDDISLENRNSILQEHGWVDPAGTRPGETAVKKDGSLVGCVIARYASDEPAFDERDWDLVREWMAKGMPVGEHVHR
jgi:hypothetical protein